MLSKEHITTYFPDRKEEGYGISTKGIEYAIENGISLVLSIVEQRILIVFNWRETMVLKLLYAITTKWRGNSQCDLHQPKQHDCSYPFKSLSGGGVLFAAIIGRKPITYRCFPLH